MPRPTPAALRVLEIGEAVPDEATDIEFVVQNPCAASQSGRGLLVSRHGLPEGPGIPFWFSFLAIARGLSPAAKSRKMRLDHLGLARIYAAAAGLSWNEIVAVAETSTRQALQNATLQTAPRLLGKILEEEGVHGALQPDVKLADLAFGQGDDRHRRRMPSA